MKPAIAVIGCHRSGTSALAGALGLLGWQLPRHVMPANSGNPLGYWEPLPIVRFDEERLIELGRSWLDPKPLHGGAASLHDHDGLTRRAAGLLKECYADSEGAVLKDPRLSLLLDFWGPVLRQAWAEIGIVIAVRHPDEVAASLFERDRIPPATGRDIWTTYTLAAERNSRAFPRVFVSYRDLVDEPRGTLESMIASLWPAGGALPADVLHRAALSIRTESSRSEGPPHGGAGESSGLADRILALCHSDSSAAAHAEWDKLREEHITEWQVREPGGMPSRFARSRPETFVASAQRLAAAGQMADSLVAARRAADLAAICDCGTPYLHLALATLLDEGGDAAAALDQACKAHSLAPKDPTVLFRIGRLRERQGDTAAAIALYREVLSQDSAHVAATRSLNRLMR